MHLAWERGVKPVGREVEACHSDVCFLRFVGDGIQ